MQKFIREHIVQLHYNYLSKNHRVYLPPLDRFLKSYFNKNKSLGSSQRSVISQKIFSMIRYEHLLSYMTKTNAFKLLEPSDKEYLKLKSQRYQPIQQDSQPSKKQYQIINDKLQLLIKNEIYSVIDNQKMPKQIYFLTNFQMVKKFFKQNVFFDNKKERMFKQLSLSLMNEKDSLLESGSHIRDGKKILEIGDEDKAFQICNIMNTRAPLTLRLNPLKITPQKFQKTLEKMEKEFKVRLFRTQYAPYGYKIIAPKNVNLLQTESFENGEFQIQDQGSQLTAMNVKCKPGDLVLDFCGGSGGKSLAIAHLLENKGQIFVHEPRQIALQKARKRFKRAGVNNVQFHSDQQSLQKILLKKADWIIVDAPCTGVGTIRRNPDIKIRFTQDYIKRNTILQNQIMAKVMKYLNKNGRIVYITCSLLRQQNQQQIKNFIQLYGLQVQNKQIMKILPQKDGMDGFFATVLKRK